MRTLISRKQHDLLLHGMDENRHGGTRTGEYGQQIFTGSLDGVPLFSDAHPYYEQIDYDPDAPIGKRIKIIDGGTYSNLTNDALTADNLWKARQNFLKLKNYRGEPARVGVPDTLVVPPELEQTAREILDRAIIEESNAGVSNITQGAFNLVVDPWISNSELGAVEFTYDSTDYSGSLDASKMWFLVSSGSSKKPFLFWPRTQLQPQRLIGQGSPDSAEPAVGAVNYAVFNDDAMIFGARQRFGMAFGHPQVIYASMGDFDLSSIEA
jgi:Mu-like prophage major head subunit gpT